MAGAELFSDVLELKDRISVRYLPSPPKFLSRGGIALFLILGPLKVIFQIFSIFFFLLKLPQPSYILVQVTSSIFPLIPEPPRDSDFYYGAISLQPPLCKAHYRLA